MNDDSGAQLRALYAPGGGVGNIFGDKVAEYAASRPDYPEALFAFLRAQWDLPAGGVVADVGAGTGLLTRGLLAAGFEVVAVEPNEGMRAAADAALGHLPGYRSVAGSAEAMPLPDASVDGIAAAQAFHWFDIPRARAECRRVLREGARVALVWNDRVVADPLHVALDAVFARYGGARRGALLAHEERMDVPRFFGAGAFAEQRWPHAHRLDGAGLQALVFSRSYMPARGSAEGGRAAAEVAAAFAAHAVDGRVEVRYTTVAIVGRIG